MFIDIKKSTKPVQYIDAIQFLEKRVEEVHHKKSNELIWILEHKSTFTAGKTYKKNEILVVSRNKQKIDKLNELGIKACEWTNTSVVKHYISISNTILISVPPFNFIDPVEEKFSEFFSQTNIL